MIKMIYYILSLIIVKMRVSEIGKRCRLRMSGKILCGKYVHIGDNVEIEKNWIIAVYPEFGGKKNPVSGNSRKGVWIGNGGSYNRNLTIYCADSVVIGANVLFGSHVLITDNNHGMNPEAQIPYKSQQLSCAPVLIEDNCWIAEKVCILKGTTIGKNSIVAAGSVVCGEFPPYSIIAGIPAKVIRSWNFEKECWERQK